MQREGTLYTIIFSCVVCGICSILVSGAAVGLKSRQEENKVLDRQQKVLSVAGLIKEDESLSKEQIKERYSQYIEPKLVNLATGEYDTSVDPMTYDQRRAAKDPATGKPAPANPAQVVNLPNLALVYLVKHEPTSQGFDEIILPVEGKGLWSMLYGYLALDKDTTTIRGIIFYEHGETPGLGGEVENPAWTAKWPGRKAFDENWAPKIQVIKGPADPDPAKDPYHVDGLSGSTLTSRGVSNLLAFWLGDNAFGPYLKRLRETGS